MGGRSEDRHRHEDVYCEWSPNEKVALEVGIGSAMGGVRTLVTMKHVGLNVAADPYMSVANTGINTGLVLLVADDPSMYSSQNEQDSRNYAAFARIPCLDPADSQEAYEYAQRAFELSEQYDTPVMLHETMRIAHTKTMVQVANARTELDARDYTSQPNKYVMMPAYAVARTNVTNAREDALVEYAETTDLNRAEYRDAKVGIIVAGALYNHVREALPDASTFKLGLSWPLPPRALADFASKVEKVYVVEEACRYFRDHVAALGIQLSEPPAQPLPRSGEIFPWQIKASFGAPLPEHFDAAQGLPPRPPAFCAGCPHRLVFCELRRIKAIVTGDIGCYTLGAVAPYKSVDSVIDMGASLSMSHGMELANAQGRTGRPVVGVIGDSTFAHSGITSLLGTAYNGGKGTLCILDNRHHPVRAGQARLSADGPGGKALHPGPPGRQAAGPGCPVPGHRRGRDHPGKRAEPQGGACRPQAGNVPQGPALRHHLQGALPPGGPLQEAHALHRAVPSLRPVHGCIKEA